MTQIIGISGKARAGKDTTANFFVDKYNFKKLSFADTLKDITSNIFNLDKDYFYNDDLKDKPFVTQLQVTEEHLRSFFAWASRVVAAKETFNEDNSIKELSGFQAESPRRLLQWLGTDVGRNHYNENIWIEAFSNKSGDYDKIVIADCRMPNEREALKQLGATLMFIKRDNVSISNGSTHYSENALGNEEDYDVIVDNNASIHELYTGLNQWYGYMRKEDVRIK